MHRYRLVGIVLSVVLTIVLSLGFASAAGHFQAPASAPPADPAAPAQSIPTEVSAQSLVGPNVLNRLANEVRSGQQVEAEDDDLDDEDRDGTGRPTEKGPPPGQLRKAEAEGQTLVADGCVAHATGQASADANKLRFQVKHSGVHAVVLAEEAKAACDLVKPSESVLNAASGLQPEATRETAGADIANFVASLENLKAADHVEQFNFYGPLAKLNQLRAPVDDEDDELDDEEDKSNEGKGKGVKTLAPFTGEIKQIKGSKWLVGETSVIVPKELGVTGEVGKTATVEGVRAGKNVKATKVTQQ